MEKFLLRFVMHHFIGPPVFLFVHEVKQVNQEGFLWQPIWHLSHPNHTNKMIFNDSEDEFIIFL